ncbi:hypothetical protein OSCI_3910003 [Kamptonema sp. PCC 6506]|nr:hypothetical protein OSCI_3910003 [Kamptonema sp. PCC 6506]
MRLLLATELWDYINLIVVCFKLELKRYSLKINLCDRDLG